MSTKRSTKSPSKETKQQEEFEVLEFPEETKQMLIALIGQTRKLGNDMSLIVDTFMQAKEIDKSAGWKFHPENVCLFKKKEK